MLGHIMKRWRSWAEASHLERLDDRLLADIGLRRDQVRERVFGEDGLVGLIADHPPTSGQDVQQEQQATKREGLLPVSTVSTTCLASG